MGLIPFFTYSPLTPALKKAAERNNDVVRLGLISVYDEHLFILLHTKWRASSEFLAQKRRWKDVTIVDSNCLACKC